MVLGCLMGVGEVVGHLVQMFTFALEFRLAIVQPHGTPHIVLLFCVLLFTCLFMDQEGIIPLSMSASNDRFLVCLREPVASFGPPFSPAG